MRYLCFALLLALWSAPGLRAETLLRFCYDPYPPYAIEKDGQAPDGIKVQILREVVGMIDEVDASVTLLPWQRCQDGVRAGEIDGILPLFPNAERRTYMMFSDAVFPEQSVFFYESARFPDGLEWSGDAEELAHFRLGMLRGGFIDEAMEASFERRGNIQRGSSVEALLRMLLTGRVDLVATDVNVGRYVAAQAGFGPQVRSIARPIVEKTSHFGLSKKTGAQSHLAAFDAALETLRRSGRLRALLVEAH